MRTKRHMFSGFTFVVLLLPALALIILSGPEISAQSSDSAVGASKGEALRIVQAAYGVEGVTYLQEGRMVSQSPGGIRSVVACKGRQDSPLTILSDEEKAYWQGTVGEFAHDMMAILPVHLLPEDPNLQYAAKTRIKEIESQTFAGYEAQGYRVEFSDYYAEQPWRLLQKAWVSGALAQEIHETGCFEAMSPMQIMQVLQAAPSKQLFYGLINNDAYGEVMMSQVPVRIEYYEVEAGDSSGQTSQAGKSKSGVPEIRAVFEVLEVGRVPIAHDLFDIPEEYEEVDSVFSLLF